MAQPVGTPDEAADSYEQTSGPDEEPAEERAVIEEFGRLLKRQKKEKTKLLIEKQIKQCQVLVAAFEKLQNEFGD